MQRRAREGQRASPRYVEYSTGVRASVCSDDLQVQTIPLEYVEAARKLWEHPIDLKPRGIGEAGPSPDSQIARTIKRAVETAIIAQAGKEAAEYKKLAYRSPYELPPLAS